MHCWVQRQLVRQNILLRHWNNEGLTCEHSLVLKVVLNEVVAGDDKEDVLLPIELEKRYTLQENAASVLLHHNVALLHVHHHMVDVGADKVQHVIPPHHFAGQKVTGDRFVALEDFAARELVQIVHR